MVAGEGDGSAAGDLQFGGAGDGEIFGARSRGNQKQAPVAFHDAAEVAEILVVIQAERVLGDGGIAAGDGCGGLFERRHLVAEVDGGDLLGEIARDQLAEIAEAGDAEALLREPEVIGLVAGVGAAVAGDFEAAIDAGLQAEAIIDGLATVEMRALLHLREGGPRDLRVIEIRVPFCKVLCGCEQAGGLQPYRIA